MPKPGDREPRSPGWCLFRCQTECLRIALGASGTARRDAAAAMVQTTVHDDQPSTSGISRGVRKPVANTVVFSSPSAVPARLAPAIDAISVYATPCHALANTPPSASTMATSTVGADVNAAAAAS